MKNNSQLINADYYKFNEYFMYCPLSGLFKWRKHKYSKYIGKVAGSIHKKGYIDLKLKGVKYKAHRVAWLLSYKSWPDGFIDHVNGVRDDNSLINLRKSNIKLNSKNRGINCNNTTGYKGVVKRGNKYHARASNGKGDKIFLGSYDCKIQAALVYDNYVLNNYEGFSRTNKSIGLIPEEMVVVIDTKVKVAYGK